MGNHTSGLDAARFEAKFLRRKKQKGEDIELEEQEINIKSRILQCNKIYG